MKIYINAVALTCLKNVENAAQSPTREVGQYLHIATLIRSAKTFLSPARASGKESVLIVPRIAPPRARREDAGVSTPSQVYVRADTSAIIPHFSISFSRADFFVTRVFAGNDARATSEPRRCHRAAFDAYGGDAPGDLLGIIALIFSWRNTYI